MFELDAELALLWEFSLHYTFSEDKGCSLQVLLLFFFLIFFLINMCITCFLIHFNKILVLENK